MRIAALSCLLLLIATTATAEPIATGAIQVIDGDTISARGQTVRLVGLDTPEGGMNAMCDAERTLAARATDKLRQLVAGGGLDITLVRCSCPKGIEGTQACNYGRACGVLTAAGKDVATVLTGEGLARPYVCKRTSCPRRQPWC